MFVSGAATVAVAGVIFAEGTFPRLRDGSFDDGTKAVETTFTLLFD